MGRLALVHSSRAAETSELCADAESVPAIPVFRGGLGQHWRTLPPPSQQGAIAPRVGAGGGQREGLDARSSTVPSVPLPWAILLALFVAVSTSLALHAMVFFAFVSSLLTAAATAYALSRSVHLEPIQLSSVMSPQRHPSIVLPCDSNDDGDTLFVVHVQKRGSHRPTMM